MRVVRWLLFVAVVAGFALFAVNNWTPVPIVLPDGTPVHPPLPVVVAAAFLVGWLPLLLLHLAARAGWRRRIAKVERLADEATRPIATLGPTPTA